MGLHCFYQLNFLFMGWRRALTHQRDEALLTREASGRRCQSVPCSFFQRWTVTKAIGLWKLELFFGKVVMVNDQELEQLIWGERSASRWELSSLLLLRPFLLPHERCLQELSLQTARTNPIVRSWYMIRCSIEVFSDYMFPRGRKSKRLCLIEVFLM